MTELVGKKIDLTESDLPEGGGDFFVTGVWWDGKPWAVHISTPDLAWSRRVDEEAQFMPKSWLTVQPCEDIFTCTCTEDWEAR